MELLPTLLAATLRRLLLDGLLTNDPRRVGAAFDHLVALMTTSDRR